MTYSDIVMVSLPYIHNFDYRNNHKPNIHYTDHSIINNEDKTQDFIEKFKQKNNISTLYYNYRIYTPIENGELKYISIKKCTRYHNCRDFHIDRIDINNRVVVIIHPDEGQPLSLNKSLLYSAKKHDNYLVLSKCSIKAHTKQERNQLQMNHNCSKFLNNIETSISPYESLTKNGLFASSTGIKCSYCDFYMQYNNLAIDKHDIENIINLHKNFTNKQKLKKITIINDNGTTLTEYVNYCSVKPHSFNLLQVHDGKTIKNFDHYHKVLLEKVSIKDILQNYNSKLEVHLDDQEIYFGKFNLETLDDEYLQEISKTPNFNSNIVVETAF